MNGLRVESTSNLSAGSSLDRALVGDFTNCFKWGYAKEMPIEVIQYGNPDNDADLGDLKGHNQVYLRGEAYIAGASWIRPHSPTSSQRLRRTRHAVPQQAHRRRDRDACRVSGGDWEPVKAEKAAKPKAAAKEKPEAAK